MEASLSIKHQEAILEEQQLQNEIGTRSSAEVGEKRSKLD